MNGFLAEYPQFRLSSSKDYMSTNLTAFYSGFGALYLLFIILAVPSLLALVNTLAIGVLERTRELGMLRAIGATRGQIRLMVLAEAPLLRPGNPAGPRRRRRHRPGAGRELDDIGFNLADPFPYSWMLVAIAIAVGFGALAAYFPGRRAARMQYRGGAAARGVRPARRCV